MLLQIVLTPLAQATDFPVGRLLRSLTVLAAVDMATETRRDLRIGLALGIPAILLAWLAPFAHSVMLAQVEFVFSAVLYIFIMVRMLGLVLRTPVVSADTIYLAVCSYVILGLIWSLAYYPIEYLSPGSFHGLNQTSARTTASDLFYFSYVTLTTLGYGDITPVSPVAKAFAILESISGTLFMAVLIAMLMGKYTSQNPARRNQLTRPPAPPPPDQS